jgi:polysaccharide export outer membrane protein
MMKTSNHLRLDMRTRNSRKGTIVKVLAAAVTLLALSLSPGMALAQFSGPSPGIATPINLPVTPTTDPAILYPASRDVVLEQGDLLTVRLYDTADYQPEVRISLDGTIQLPLIGSLHVEGLTLHQTERLIAERLMNEGMYRNPQVTIQLTEAPNQAVTVTGEMHGVVPIAGEKRLFDVLSVAGGLPPTASHLITINRPGVSQPIVVDLGSDPARSEHANVPVFPRDTIVVSRVGVVYLLGAFKTQGAIPLQQNTPLTLMQAASIGGGPGFEGKLNDLRIVRTVGYDRKVVTVDIRKVIRGQAPDPVLQADDIVLLPTSLMRAAIKSGGLATLTGLASILVVAFRY